MLFFARAAQKLLRACIEEGVKAWINGFPFKNDDKKGNVKLKLHVAYFSDLQQTKITCYSLVYVSLVERGYW